MPSMPVSQTNSSTTASPVSKLNLRDRLILIADDAPDNRTLLEVILKRAGARTAIAVDGLDVINKTLEMKPDAIIMDIQMPGLDGYTASAKLRELGFKGTIISCTARAMFDDISRSVRSGCNAHLTKPLHRSDLLKLFENLWADDHQTESHGREPSGNGNAPVNGTHH
jgi:CheY-like chemotaxis protein